MVKIKDRRVTAYGMALIHNKLNVETRKTKIKNIG